MTTQRLGFEIVAVDKTAQAFNSVKRFTDQVQTVQRTVKGLSGPMAQAERSTSQFGNRLQNASFQLSDFAVQVGGGVDATRALAQQLPQLLSGFGVFGAVAGAAASVLLPLASHLLGIGEATKAAGDLADAAALQVDRLNAALTRASEDFSNAGIQAGAYTEHLQRLNQLRVGVELAKSQAELRTAITAVGTEIRNQVGTFDAWSIANSNVGQVLAGVRTELLAAESGFSRFRGALMATTDKAREITALTVGLKELGLESNLAFTEARRLYDALASNNIAVAASEFDRLAGIVTKYGMATDSSKEASIKLLELLGKLSGAAIDYQRNLAVAVERQQKLFSGVGSYGPSTATSGTTIKPEPSVEQRRSLEEAASAARKAQADYDSFLGTIERGVSPLLRTQDLLQQAEANFAEFGGKMSPEQFADYIGYATDLKTKIDELTFKEKWDEMAEGIQTATDAMLPFRDAVEQIGRGMQDSLVNGLSDAFTSFIDGTESAKGALKGFAQSFVKEMTAMIVKAMVLYAVQKALGMATGSMAFGSLMQSYGGVYGNGLLSNAKGNAFSGGRVMAFANGGVVGGPTFFPMAGGRAGLMGEAGPEAIVPLSRRNGKLGVGASPVNVTVNNYAGAEVRTNRGEDGRLQIDILKAEIAKDIARGGNTLAQTFERSYAMRRVGR